jgi:hypothetical protein
MGFCSEPSSAVPGKRNVAQLVSHVNGDLELLKEVVCLSQLPLHPLVRLTCCELTYVPFGRLVKAGVHETHGESAEVVGLPLFPPPNLGDYERPDHLIGCARLGFTGTCCKWMSSIA